MHDVIVETLLRAVYVFFFGLCYALGWPLAKLFTLGSYPRKYAWLDNGREALWTSTIGMVVLVVLVLAVCGQF